MQLLFLPLLCLIGIFTSPAYSQICSASLDFFERTTFPGSNNQVNVLGDINILNTGKCAITGISFFYGSQLPVSQTWNLDASNLPFYSVTGFGDSIAVNSSYSGAGLVYSYTSNPDLTRSGVQQITLHSVQCSGCALGSTQSSLVLDVEVFAVVGSIQEPPSAQVVVPAGYKVIGGGFYVANYSDYSASQSYPVDASTWSVQLRGFTADQGPSSVTAYAIAIYDPTNQWDVVTTSSTSGAGQPQGEVTASVASGYTLCGGGFSTDEFVDNSYPNSANTWISSFHIATGGSGYSENGITSYAIGIRSNIAGITVTNSIFSFEIFYPSVEPIAGSYLGGGGFATTNALVYASCPFTDYAWQVKAVEDQSSAAPSQINYGLGLSLTASSGASTATTSSVSSTTTGTSTTTSTTTGTSTTGTPACSNANVQLTQTLVNSWEGGSQWTVTLANAGTTPVSGVNVVTQNAASITGLWSMTNAADGHYTLPSYVQSIAVAGSFSYGYTASTTTEVDFAVFAVTC